MKCGAVRYGVKVEANVPNRLEHFSAELLDMGAVAMVIGDRTVAVSLSRPPCQVWIARKALSVTLPDSCILALHHWPQSAFDSFLFPISEDATYVIDAGEENLHPSLKQKVKPWNLQCFAQQPPSIATRSFKIGKATRSYSMAQ